VLLMYIARPERHQAISAEAERGFVEA